MFGDLWGVEGVKVSPRLKEAELTLFNLENPIIEHSSNSPIDKEGVTLCTELKLIRSIVEQFSGTIFFSLANNHIGDYGESGIISTIESCKKLHAYYSGVAIGNEISPSILKIANNRVAVFSIAERQFGISSIHELGYTYYDESIFPKIVQARRDGQFVIVSVHYGSEMSIWPSPISQRLFRSFIDCGASIVYGHHSHVPKGFEVYHDGLIMYGLGNFVIPDKFLALGRNLNWSHMVELTIENNILTNYEIIPIRMERGNIVTMSKKEGNYKEYIIDANRPIEEDRLEGLWQAYSMLMFENEYKYWLLSDGNEYYRTMYHILNCKTHAESIRTYFGIKSGSIKDVRNNEVNMLAQKYFQLF